MEPFDDRFIIYPKLFIGDNFFYLQDASALFLKNEIQPFRRLASNQDLSPIEHPIRL